MSLNKEVKYQIEPTTETADNVKSELKKIRSVVSANAERVAQLGKWPPNINLNSLIRRVPSYKNNLVTKKWPGFDAGIACALDLIPRNKQELSAKLHANYTEDSVKQVRKEIVENNSDSETIWWLSATSLCKEGEINAIKFLKQIEDFKELAVNKDKRLEAAQKTINEMIGLFMIKDGVPYGEEDGCIHGAYLAGYPFGVMRSKNYNLYFIGTYEESLGLENFEWSNEKDENGNPKSGQVFGSKQFVRCADEDELKRALKTVKEKLLKF